VSPTLANFLFEAANFLLLSAALGWVLFKPVRRALDAERERHAKEEDEAKRLRAEAEALAQEARAVREAAEREGARQRSEALAAARAEAARIAEEARASEARERQRIEGELEARRHVEAVALADTMGRVAAESVRRLLLSVGGPSLDAALARAATAALRQLTPAARASATVESARALEADARGFLEEALGCTVRERVVPDLGAGVRVTTPEGQVDASAESLAREAARAVSAAVGPTPGGGDARA
jgi:F-type H+-transporting ATPase subunit b